MKYKLGELEELFSKIQRIVGYIEYSKYEDREDILYLSNGEKFKYKMSNEQVPHLLGINIDYLRGTGCFRSTNAFEILKELISNAYNINDKVNQGILSYDQMFSEYIEEKIKVFDFNIKINIFETELVCKYDSSKTYALTDKNEKFDYIIVKKYKDSDSYGILGLIKNQNYYKPVTSLYFENYESMKEKLSELIKNQEVTLLGGEKTINIYEGYERPFALQEDIKITKATNLLKYKRDFGCIIDTTSDFIHLLKYSLGCKKNYYGTGDLLENIKNAITNAELLDLHLFENTDLYELAKTINDRLHSDGITNDSIGESYSNLYEERNELKKDNTSMIEMLNDYKSQLEKIKQENHLLEEENKKHQENKEQILKILKPSE